MSSLFTRTYQLACLVLVFGLVHSGMVLPAEAADRIPRYTVSGYVRGQNGENLVGATVLATAKGTGTVTNPYGYYSLVLDSGEHTLVVQYLGYQKSSKNLRLVRSIQMNWILEESMVEGAEIVVEGKR
ncbi:MAG: carboxypeptidase-like regulatory domain-containing protein, partial [Bacteroidia bacterium]